MPSRAEEKRREEEKSQEESKYKGRKTTEKRSDLDGNPERVKDLGEEKFLLGEEKFHALSLRWRLKAGRTILGDHGQL